MDAICGGDYTNEFRSIDRPIIDFAYLFKHSIVNSTVQILRIYFLIFIVSGFIYSLSILQLSYTFSDSKAHSIQHIIAKILLQSFSNNAANNMLCCMGYYGYCSKWVSIEIISFFLENTIEI